MARTPTEQIALGFEAPAFTLPDVTSDSAKNIQQLKGARGTVVMFICNHCPYVKHVIGQIVSMAKEYQPKGIGFIAISSNDVENYPDDSPEKMKQFARENDFTFPYLYDESQEVAKAYHAACTPDFSVFDSSLKCVYRGRLDGATPGNEEPNDGHDLRAVLNAILEGRAVSEDQKPSLGCNIKWKK
jgi:peroxiredoxin